MLFIHLVFINIFNLQVQLSIIVIYKIQFIIVLLKNVLI